MIIPFSSFFTVKAIHVLSTFELFHPILLLIRTSEYMHSLLVIELREMGGGKPAIIASCNR